MDGRESMERKMAEYSAMSREALGCELEKEAAALKAKGMLDIPRLEEFLRTASPYMSAEQVARMRELIDALRRR